MQFLMKCATHRMPESYDFIGTDVPATDKKYIVLNPRVSKFF